MLWKCMQAVAIKCMTSMEDGWCTQAGEKQACRVGRPHACSAQFLSGCSTHPSMSLPAVGTLLRATRAFCLSAPACTIISSA